MAKANFQAPATTNNESGTAFSAQHYFRIKNRNIREQKRLTSTKELEKLKFFRHNITMAPSAQYYYSITRTKEPFQEKANALKSYQELLNLL